MNSYTLIYFLYSERELKSEATGTAHLTPISSKITLTLGSAFYIHSFLSFSLPEHTRLKVYINHKQRKFIFVY